MALNKKIELDSGVVVNYHRVVSVNKITNIQNIIEVASYTSEAKRDEEREAVATGNTFNVFIETTYLNAPYNQSMNIRNAYDYLKTLPEFEGAEDVVEAGEDIYGISGEEFMSMIEEVL